MTSSTTALPADQSIKAPDRLFIGGEWVKASTDDSLTVVAPATEEPYARVAEAREPDIDRAVDAARNAFDNGPWRKLSHRERGDYVRKLAQGLADRSGDVAQTWPNEMGVTHALAQFMTARTVNTYQNYADLADSYPFEERRQASAPELTGIIVREPVGVVAAIIPWNAPVMLICHKLAPALIAGCTVIIKASPEAPLAAYIMAEIAEAAGLPRGVVNVVTADRQASEHLVRHPGIDKVTFTGSTAAGKRIASLLGERVARYTLELGGKSAAVILDDYDVEQAAATLAGPACSFSGQVCSSLTRIIVTQDRQAALVDALASRFAEIRVGDPFDPASHMGPVAMRRQRDRIESLIGAAKAEGATLAFGGGRPAHLDRGFYIEPTIFCDVDNDSTIAREEVFGPVLSVIPARDEADAVRIANDTAYGLNNSVFTNDVDRAYAVARELRSGTVGHNGMRMDFGIAFGGFKQSGIGREGHAEGLATFLETKTLLLCDSPSHLGA
ncbi:aldehyde dehydrogenase [Sphingobium sp.]|uniref:aldehyde dehydrogenase n=1 Tax=Sphingobium sp. TaxID=1912891 RepID=UPI002BA1637B|nr:aldehyde dehydrogenase [Sphingobium sp.]HUD90642.1 aldehyde dehydrogenase [Sphingobium sp.]